MKDDDWPRIVGTISGLGGAVNYAAAVFVLSGQRHGLHHSLVGLQQVVDEGLALLEDGPEPPPDSNVLQFPSGNGGPI